MKFSDSGCIEVSAFQSLLDTNLIAVSIANQSSNAQVNTQAFNSFTQVMRMHEKSETLVSKKNKSKDLLLCCRCFWLFAWLLLAVKRRIIFHQNTTKQSRFSIFYLFFFGVAVGKINRHLQTCFYPTLRYRVHFAGLPATDQVDRASNSGTGDDKDGGQKNCCIFYYL